MKILDVLKNGRMISKKSLFEKLIVEKKTEYSLSFNVALEELLIGGEIFQPMQNYYSTNSKYAERSSILLRAR